MTKILIIDNTLSDRMLVSNTLLLAGYDVFQAKNGSVGFIMALKEKPDLIISEVVLPELSGLEMLKKLNKETTTNIPLIFLSKKDKKEDVRNGMNAGAEDYLLKPFNKEDLLKAVKRIIKKQQLNKDNIEKALEKNKFLQREAGRMAKIGYWSYDIQSNMRTWSNEMHEVFGTDAFGEAPEYDITLNCYDKESRKRIIEANLNLTDNGVLYDMEFQITNLKNQRIWIQVIGEPIYNSENEIIGSKGIARDITLLKNNQEALKASNERFEFVALATNDAVWDWDLITGRIYRSKAGHKEVFGFDTERIKEEYHKKVKEENYHLDVFIHPDDKDRIGKELKRLRASLDVNNFSLEYRTPSVDGDFLYIKDNGFIVRDKKGIAIRMIGAASNITERKNAEKSLEESFSNIEAILEATADGILVVDDVGNIVRFNKKFLKLWKIPKHIMASMDDNKALDSVLNQLENPQKMLAKVKELYANPKAISSDIIELKDGRVFERYSQPNIMNGVNRGRVWSFRNITARINTEKEKQQLFALIETSNDIIAFGNMNGDPTFFNKAGRKHLGIDKNRPISSYHHSDFFNTKQVNLDTEISNSLFNKGSWEGDTQLTNLKTKKKIPVHMSAFVIRDNSTGKAIGIGNISRDITNIEKINKELVQAKERAEKLAGFKDQFLANMSHEIRTPLGIIIGFTKILLRNAVDENQKDQLTAIKTSGDTLLVVINDILDLAKIKAGKMTLEKTELKVPDLIDTILNTFKLQLEKKEQTLKMNCDKRIPKWLLGDPLRINQILFNLIGNAIKFTPSRGSIGVNVNLLKQDKEKVFIEIMVSDSGIGIPKDKIDKIFNLYSQNSKSTTREYGGSGLGLHIVKQLTDLMKGTVLVKSSLGIGSTFTVTIPLLKTSITENKIKPNVANDEKLEPSKNIKILIVDDMLINQFLVKTIIHRLGFKTDVADNGEIAIALLEKNDYDIILMDLQMPKMNGWKACMYIRNKMQGQKSRTPIIALSANVLKGDIDRCKEVGMDDYVSKPINETELLDKITRLVTIKNDKIIEYQQEATKICNLEYLKDHLNNKPVYITEMLQMILKEIPVIIEQANKSIAAGDWKGLHRKIHSIKPTLILMGLPKEIIATSKQIEENAEKKEHLDVVRAQFIKLEKALEKGYTELEVELNTIKS